uniref:Kinetochore protein Nuf2 N-terminal domain-containing protein n=1 Tax=Arion vulgaris TaxID=1028688 RepID=A0A0B7B8U4_9EUPU
MSYDYPILSTSDILSCFKELDISVSENDLKNPEPRRWHDIYASIFETLTNRPIEQAIQSMFKVERMQTDYHDLFEEGFAQMAFTICLQSVVGRFGFNSFSIKDVIQPTASRVQRVCSIFCNALKHIQVKQLHANKIMEDIQTSKGEFESVYNQNRKLKELLDNAEKVQPQTDAEFQKLQQEFDHNQQAVNELNKVQEEERRSVEELKFHIAEVDKEKENMKQQFQLVQTETEKLSNKIVQSPKRFRKESERCRSKVDERKAELVTREQTFSEHKILMEKTANKLEAIKKAVKLSQEVYYDQEIENKVDAEIHRLAEGMHENKEMYNSCFQHEEHLSEKLRVRQEQRHKLSSQRDFSEQSVYQQLTDIRQLQERLKEKIKSLENEVSQVVTVSTVSSRECAKLDKMLEDKKHENQRYLEETLVGAGTGRDCDTRMERFQRCYAERRL